MITPYINQIQKIFLNSVKHYKVNTTQNRELKSETIAHLEKITQTKFSQDLREFLEWSCVMPIWGVPFFPFDGSSDTFKVWSNQADIIDLYLTSKSFQVHRFEIMHGEKVSSDETTYLFKVCVDINQEHTGIKEGVYIVYGKKKNAYDEFESEDNITTFKVSENIKDFIIKYLEFLKQLPLKVKNFPNIDKLFDNPEKLFKYASQYNWDNGEEKMEYIISNKKCDEATALVIYWLSAPYDFEDSGSDLGLLPFVIENNFKKDFYTKSKNTFDPKNNAIADFIKEYYKAKDRSRDLPKFMLEKKV